MILLLFLYSDINKIYEEIKQSFFLLNKFSPFLSKQMIVFDMLDLDSMKVVVLNDMLVPLAYHIKVVHIGPQNSDPTILCDQMVHKVSEEVNNKFHFEYS